MGENVTYARYKNDHLVLTDDIFYYNMLHEFDWKYTLEFISNRTRFSSRQTSTQDSMERSYKVKNFL